MSSLSWAYLMLLFWTMWVAASASIYYWFNLSEWMMFSLDSLPASFFFFFFYYSEPELVLNNDMMGDFDSCGVFGDSWSFSLYNFKILMFIDF